MEDLRKANFVIISEWQATYVDHEWMPIMPKATNPELFHELMGVQSWVLHWVLQETDKELSKDKNQIRNWEEHAFRAMRLVEKYVKQQRFITAKRGRQASAERDTKRAASVAGDNPGTRGRDASAAHPPHRRSNSSTPRAADAKQGMPVYDSRHPTVVEKGTTDIYSLVVDESLMARKPLCQDRVGLQARHDVQGQGYDVGPG